MVPRLDAHALVDDAGATTTRSGRSPTTTLVRQNGRAAGRAGVRARRHREPSTTTATGASPSTTPRPPRPTCACGSPSRTAGPDPATPARAADALVPQHLGVGPARRRRRAARSSATATAPCVAEHRPRSAAWPSPATARRHAAALRQRDQHASGCGASPGRSPYPKDGINDHVVHGARHGQPGARRHQGVRSATTSPCRRAGAAPSCGLRLRSTEQGRPRPGPARHRLRRRRSARPPGRGGRVLRGADAGRCDRRRSAVMRQAFAGSWVEKCFHFDVERWLEGDPAHPAPPDGRRHGRNAEWRHLDAAT